MKRTLSLLLAVCLLLSCAAIFAGCDQKTNSNDFPVTFGDVTIESEPTAIVVLNDDLADIISYIGYDVKMVGRSEECDQDFLYVVPTVGKAASPDVNAIIASGADMVIADSTLPAEAKQSLEAAEIKVVLMEPARTEAELPELYKNLGTVLGGKETGLKKGEDGCKTLFDTLKTLNTASSTDIVKTAAYLYLDDNGQLCTFVQGSLEQKFFSYNGASNVFANQTEPVINTDDLRLESPSFIFCDSEEVLNVLQSDPNLSRVHALVNGHTLVIPKESFNRHGTTIEKTVFDMLSYIEKASKATPDEATPDTATTAATEAPTEEATEELSAEEDAYYEEDYGQQEVNYSFS